MADFLIGIFASFLFFCLLLSIEYFGQKNHYPKESTRKLAHILSGFFGVLMALILKPYVFIVCAIIFFFVISLSYLNNFLTSIHEVRRKTFGEILLPLGILSAYLVAGGPEIEFLAPVLILSLADPFSGIIRGGKFLRQKQIIGSLVFFVLTLIILLIFLGNKPLTSLLIITLTLTIVEKISPYGTDNFSIPLAGSLLLRLFF